MAFSVQNKCPTLITIQSPKNVAIIVHLKACFVNKNRQLKVLGLRLTPKKGLIKV